MEEKTLKKWNIVRDTERNNANNIHAIKREDVKKYKKGGKEVLQTVVHPGDYQITTEHGQNSPKSKWAYSKKPI